MTAKPDFWQARRINKNDEALIAAYWVLTISGLVTFVAGTIFFWVVNGWLLLYSVIGLVGLIMIGLSIWALWYVLHQAKDKNELNYEKRSGSLARDW
jgi:cadmium resistance protein CadD (predicted permease)